MKFHQHVVLPFLSMLLPIASALAESPAKPFISPYLAASTYPITHANYDTTPLAGPVGPSQRLRKDEIRWKPVGPLSTFPQLYSAPYPNGKRVIWVGSYERVAKLDADTLEVLTTYAIGGDTYFGNDEIERHIATMDKLDDKGLADYNIKFWKGKIRAAVNFYRMLSKDNEFYLPNRGADDSISLQVYGEADATDPASKILLRREWKLPAGVSHAGIMGMNMTPDGWIVIAIQDGTLIALSHDFTDYKFLKLPSKNEDRPSEDVFSSFLRNGVSIDDQGGIYVVTRDYLHRVQWTGSQLSLDEADGAWSISLPNENGLGSGTTPGLMGWGPKEDHLVLIADASRSNNMMAFWRDAIPADWKGLPGFDRRVAGITPVHFGVSATEQVQIENSPIIYGYGAFEDNAYPVQRLPAQGSASMQWLMGALSFHIPGHGALGGAMIRWDPQERVLKQTWSTQTNFAGSVCTVSTATVMLYCWGARNREWTLEGTDWNTGKSTFTYTLGKSQRFNNWWGTPILIAPNGAADCGCAPSLGMVRVNPRRGVERNGADKK